MLLDAGCAYTIIGHFGAGRANISAETE